MSDSMRCGKILALEHPVCGPAWQQKLYKKSLRQPPPEFLIQATNIKINAGNSINEEIGTSPYISVGFVRNLFFLLINEFLLLHFVRAFGKTHSLPMPTSDKIYVNTLLKTCTVSLYITCKHCRMQEYCRFLCQITMLTYPTLLANIWACYINMHSSCTAAVFNPNRN